MKKLIKVLKVKVLYAENHFNDIIFTHYCQDSAVSFLYFISNCMYLLTKIALVYLGPDYLCRGAISSVNFSRGILSHDFQDGVLP